MVRFYLWEMNFIVSFNVGFEKKVSAFFQNFIPPKIIIYEQ